MQELQRNPARFVDQDRFGGEDAPPDQRGNCFQVCIATLLNLPVALVPHFYDGTRNDLEATIEMAKWLAGRGWTRTAYNWPDFRGWQQEGLLQVPQGSLAILSGQSPRGDWLHAVIAIYSDRSWKLMHDPHPSKAGIKGEPTMIELLAPIPWVAC